MSILEKKIVRESGFFWFFPSLLMLLVSLLIPYSLNAGKSQSHATHFLSPKGPQFSQDESGCSECHAGGEWQCQEDGPVFADILSLGSTEVCDPCHSQEGVFDGVNDAVIGAKANWADSIYEADGITLQSGKEQWCATCHDDNPSQTVEEIDDFEGYEDDAGLQAEWEAGTDARLLQLSESGGPDGSKCVDVIIKWTRTADTYGVAKRTFDPPINLTGMEYVNFSVKIDDPSKFDRIKVRVVNADSEFCGANFYTSQLVPGQWKQVWLRRSAFSDVNDPISWEEVSEIQFRIFENSPTEDYEESVYIDNVHCTHIELPAEGIGPNVVGDNQTYGYYVTGHGSPSINHGCLDCHDPAAKHIDGQHRTYSATADYVANPEMSYRNGYRLNEDMAIPRTSELGASAFTLCTNCHEYDKLCSDVYIESNFRQESSGEIFHAVHLEDIVTPLRWDSDWDAVPGDPENYLPYYMNGAIDSNFSCPACHNVHGSSTHAMTRHGELISTQGTTDKVPGLDFMWLDVNLNSTDDLSESRYGRMIAGPQGQSMDNHICTDCHRHDLEWIEDEESERYDRLPYIHEVLDAWTSIPDGPITDTFSPGDPIRYHVSFRIFGKKNHSYTVKTAEETKARSTSGTFWETTDLAGREETLPNGSHEWFWDRSIPAEATQPSTALVRIEMKLKYDPTGALILAKWHEFNIE